NRQCAQVEMNNAPAFMPYQPAGNDARINATIPATDSGMKKLNKPYEYHIFEGAGHGFLRGQDQSPANQKAAEEAWPRTIAFFRAKLGK
ncbi:MAG: dienelactone hydrolase family protein, partial [Gemmatimonas sp.]